jgi:hypothetical protein
MQKALCLPSTPLGVYTLALALSGAFHLGELSPSSIIVCVFPSTEAGLAQEFFTFLRLKRNKHDADCHCLPAVLVVPSTSSLNRASARFVRRVHRA